MRFTYYGVLFCTLLFCVETQATIYVAAHDAKTGAIGLAYSSSGGNFWQSRLKDKGLIGQQSYGLCKNATPERFLKQGLSAEAIATKLEAQCDQVHWHRYRLAIITADGEIASVIARQGCHANNQSCGELWGKDFLIMGGGLIKGVLEAGRKKYESLNADQSLACRLYQTLTAIYAAGGEKKNFRGASITIDHPKFKKLSHWEARGKESTLLNQLNKQLKVGGHLCG